MRAHLHPTFQLGIQQSLPHPTKSVKISTPRPIIIVVPQSKPVISFLLVTLKALFPLQAQITQHDYYTSFKI